MNAPSDVFEMSAQRESACPDCGEKIRVGHRITLADAPHGDFVWVHATCPEPRRVCPTCFLIMPMSGECC